MTRCHWDTKNLSNIQRQSKKSRKNDNAKGAISGELSTSFQYFSLRNKDNFFEIIKTDVRSTLLEDENHEMPLILKKDDNNSKNQRGIASCEAKKVKLKIILAQAVISSQ